ncbi:hypothetical protein Tco_0691001 [Tanacetum coccineum]
MKTLKKQKIDIEDASDKGKDDVVKDRMMLKLPVKKTGYERSKRQRKGYKVFKTAQDEFNKEKEKHM